MVDVPERWEPEPMSGCWLWTGAWDNKGYGHFPTRTRPRKTYFAHRAMYINTHGNVGKLVIDHKCRVPSCCNPAHLRAVTQKENIAVAVGHNATKTHCKQGHPFSGDNLTVYATKRGTQRICRTCQNNAALAWWYRNRRKGATV